MELEWFGESQKNDRIAPWDWRNGHLGTTWRAQQVDGHRPQPDTGGQAVTGRGTHGDAGDAVPPGARAALGLGAGWGVSSRARRRPPGRRPAATYCPGHPHQGPPLPLLDSRPPYRPLFRPLFYGVCRVFWVFVEVVGGRGPPASRSRAAPPPGPRRDPLVIPHTPRRDSEPGREGVGRCFGRIGD